MSFLRGSRGVAAFFKDAQKANAVVVLDGAEILLSSIASQYCSVTIIVIEVMWVALMHTQ